MFAGKNAKISHTNNIIVYQIAFSATPNIVTANIITPYCYYECIMPATLILSKNSYDTNANLIAITPYSYSSLSEYCLRKYCTTCPAEPASGITLV